MRMKYLPALGLLALGACGTVLSESSSTIVVDGESYELTTRLIDGPQGTYEQSSVSVRNKPNLCLPDSPGDCTAAVRSALRNGSSDN